MAGFPALEFAVAETFGFSCFGFFASLLLFLPLAMVCPSKMQRSDAGMAGAALRSCTKCPTGHRMVVVNIDQGNLPAFSAASSIARCCPRDTVEIGDRKIAFAASKSAAVSISVQLSPVISIAWNTVPFSASRA